MRASSYPRLTLALLAAFVGTVFGWGAFMLPWRDWTLFAAMTASVAVAHGLTAITAAAGLRVAATFWRIQAGVALVYLGYLTWNILTSAVYVAELYGGLGEGVAVALGLIWLIVVALTVPFSAWGIAATGGLRWNGRSRIAVGAVVVLLGVSLLRSSQAAAATPKSGVDDREGGLLEAQVVAAIPPASERRPIPPDETAPSLMVRGPATCAASPTEVEATVFAVYLAHAELERPQAVVRCYQGSDLATALAAMRAQMQADAYVGPVKIDVVTGVAPLHHVVPVVDAMTLRPGLDGACDETRCLAPWQMVAHDLFRQNTPIPVIADLRFGFDPVMVRRALRRQGRIGHYPRGIDGLVRVETASLLLDEGGTLHRLRRLMDAGPPLEPETLEAGVRAAEDYIAAAQDPDGRFEYKLDPFTGKLSYRGFSLPRQAGTTLVMCELARDRTRAREIAIASLEMMASTLRRSGDRGTLRYPAQKRFDVTSLGDTALPTIAFLRCRDLVGDRFDDTIAAMARFLLAMQKPSGGFYPKYDLAAGEPLPGPDPLYAVGQAVYALTLLERVAEENPAFPEASVLREAVERAMDYIAGPYWNESFLADFFFLEENWHCLAAEASLTHHRHDGYERFCLDYVTFKSKLILDEASRVDSDLLGGYGFGNVIVPHSTGSAGFGEAAAAALALAEARDLALPRVESRLRLALAFLLHKQWDEVRCFACSAPHPVEGGFSENMGTTEIRIDFVQHAMAAMGHGGRALGLLHDPTR